MNPPTRYDNRTIALHWMTSTLVIALWLLGQVIDWFPRGDSRVAARSVHILLGVALALVLLLRIWWRFGGGGVKLPPAGAGRLDMLASVTHKALYVLLAATVLLGIANAWIRGDKIFALLTIPAFAPGNTDLRETMEDWHGLAANVLFFVALAHAGAALLHHFVLKDGVLRRMLPARPER